MTHTTHFPSHTTPNLLKSLGYHRINNRLARGISRVNPRDTRGQPTIYMGEESRSALFTFLVCFPTFFDYPLVIIGLPKADPQLTHS